MMRVKRAALILSLMSMGSIGCAAEYTWDTPTVNNWNVVITGGDHVYADGDIIGGNGTSTVPEPSAISAGKGSVSNISSPGTINVVVRPKPGLVPYWLYGIYAYSSTGGAITSQTTEINFNTKLNVDVETAAKQTPGKEELGDAIHIRARGTSGMTPGATAVTKANFADDVDIKVVNKTTDAGSAQLNSNSVHGISISSFDGGRNEVVFNKKLNIVGEVTPSDKHIYGIRYIEQGTNGAGSKLELKGDTTIDVSSMNGGRAWGAVLQAAGGKQSMSTAQGTKLSIKSKQLGGTSYAQALIINTLEQGGTTGDQDVKFDGSVDLQSEGDYYALGLRTEAKDGGYQKITFNDEFSVKSKAAQFTYGINVNGDSGGKSEIVAAKGIKISAEGQGSTWGIYGTTKNSADNSIVAESAGEITVSSSTGRAMGVYSESQSGGKRSNVFKNGLTVSASSTRAVALRSLTDSSENASSVIKVEGDADISAGSAAGAWAAWSTGAGAEIAVNGDGGKTVKGLGISYASDKGKISWNLDKAGSSLTGNLSAESEALIDLKMAQEGTVFRGSASRGNSGQVDISAKEGAVWEFTGNSWVSNLELNDNAVVDMSFADGYQMLATKNLSGSNGLFLMDINAGTNVDNSDRIYVTEEFTGQQYLALNEIGHGDIDSAAGTVLATVNVNNGTFLAKDGPGTLYYKRYLLDSKETADTTGAFTTDWYLKKISYIDPNEKPTPGVDTTISSNSLNYHTWREHDKLLQRMGELRHNGEEEKGIWFRAKGSKIGYDGKFGFKNRFRHYELGYDEITKRTDKVIRYQGASLSYTDGSGTFKYGKGDNDSKAITFYSTDIRNKGHYLDLVAKFSRMDNDFTGYDPDLNERFSGEYSNKGVSLTAEYGRKKNLDKGWYIEPQAQLTLGYLGTANFTLSNDVRVHQGGIKSAVGRVGFNIGKEVGSRGIVYAKANLLHEFGGSYHVRMKHGSDSLSYNSSFRDTWFEYGLGVAFATGETSHMYFDVERSAGGKFSKDWQWNAGVRFNF